jgi:hypothetical protein
MRSAEKRWRAGDPIKWTCSDELAEIERAKQAAKPWLYAPQASTGPCDARVSPVGVPIAIKIGVAIGQARRRDQLVAAHAHATAAHASGMIGRESADALDDAILEKQKGLEWHRAWWQRIAPPRILKRVGNRRPRIEHRAKLAASGPMPPDLAKQFTVGELSVMKIVADEVALHGTCRLTKAEMSDRSQASETTVHNAIRKAHSLDMLGVKRRPAPGRKNLPNLITIVDNDWMLWVMRPKYRAIREDATHDAAIREASQRQGANRSTPQSVHIYKKDETGAWRDQEEVDRGRERIGVAPPGQRDGVMRRRA